MSTDLDHMTPEDLYQRLASIAVELERLGTSVWLLERERDEVRGQLRRLNAIPTIPKAAA
ncbi:MAG: hypothetical protein ACLQJ0_16085 [Steroidobacteraceae bacterium]